MTMRVGKVVNVIPGEGKVKVQYEDEGNTSLPLSMLTMNNEVSMPAVGDMVVTMHMQNGGSKGFVLGTYYGGSMKPKASGGYRKDFSGGAYASCSGGTYTLNAKNISLKTSYGTITVEEIMKRLERIEDQLGLPHTI